MKFYKGLVTGIILTLIVSLTLPAFADAVTKKIEVVFNKVNIEVNGKKVDADNIVYNGTTYVPLRAVADAFGKVTGWDPATNTASINDKGVSTTNSRTNPAKLNEKITVINKDFLDGVQKFEISLIDVVRGDDAWDMVEKGNPFNEQPDTGKEYILAKFKIKVLETESDKPLELYSGNFTAVSKTGVAYDDFLSVSGLDPDIATSLYQGSEYEGWTYFMVNTEDEPVAALYKGWESETWFSLNDK